MSTFVFADGGLRDALASSRPTDWWTLGFIAVPLVIALLVLMVRRSEKSPMREWIGVVFMIILGINIGGQWPGGSPIRWLQPMLARSLQAATTPKPEEEKPTTEQPSEVAPATETPTTAEAPKGETAQSKTPKTTAEEPEFLDNPPSDAIVQIGREFTFQRKAPKNGYWAYAVMKEGDDKPVKLAKVDPKATSVTIDIVGKSVRFYQENAEQTGKYLEFPLHQEVAPPAGTKSK